MITARALEQPHDETCKESGENKFQTNTLAEGPKRTDQ